MHGRLRRQGGGKGLLKQLLQFALVNANPINSRNPQDNRKPSILPAPLPYLKERAVLEKETLYK